MRKIGSVVLGGGARYVRVGPPSKAKKEGRLEGEGKEAEQNEESNADNCCKCDAKEFKFGVEVWRE